VILVWITFDVLNTAALKKFASGAYARLPQNRRAFFGVLIFLLGAGLLWSYWWGINKAFTLTRARATTEVEAPAPGEGPPEEEPAKIEFRTRILSPPPAHPPDTVLAGIAWKKSYADVRLDVINGVVPIHNLDLKVILDNGQGIAGLGQLSNFPSVAIFPTEERPPRGPPGPVVGLRVITPEGIFPADPFKEDSTVRYAYRIHCDNIFPESTLRFIVASVPFGSWQTQNSMQEAPRSIHLSGSYDTNGLAGPQTHPIDTIEILSK
jgi:hypothetical protein